VLTLNGVALDLSGLPPGGTLAPEAARYPVPLTLSADGPVALPGGWGRLAGGRGSARVPRDCITPEGDR
jgi:hypothetical protein